MKNETFNINPTASIYQQFRDFYRIPGWKKIETDSETVLIENQSTALKVKHWATYLALAIIQKQDYLSPTEQKSLTSEVIRHFRENSQMVVQTMEESFAILVGRMASFN